MLFVGVAHAASDYSSNQVVKFFIKSANMGAARGLCIGTVVECISTSSKLAGFDMLVNFEYNSAELSAAAKANLEQIAIALQDPRFATANFIVEGHTDAQGTEIYNLSLSERRAHSVISFLLERGVNPDKVTAVGIGEKSPRTTDGLDPANRRVEIRISLR